MSRRGRGRIGGGVVVGTRASLSCPISPQISRNFPIETDHPGVEGGEVDSAYRGSEWNGRGRDLCDLITRFTDRFLT